MPDAEPPLLPPEARARNAGRVFGESWPDWVGRWHRFRRGKWTVVSDLALGLVFGAIDATGITLAVGCAATTHG